MKNNTYTLIYKSAKRVEIATDVFSTSRKPDETNELPIDSVVIREFTTELFQQIRREEDEISARVARDIEVLRRRSPQTRWQ